jgi:valyl-tRNA synthetase
MIYEFGLRYGQDLPSGSRELFQDALRAVWDGYNEIDGFNGLVLAAGLTWRQATVLRAYAKYMRQGNSPFAQDYIEGALRGNVDITRLLVALFEASLRLLHPIMPFITDEIWHVIYDGEPPQKSLALAAYPQADEQQIDRAAETQMAILQDLIVSVRNLRAELKVETKLKVPIEIYAFQPEMRGLIEENRGAILNDRQSNVASLTFAEAPLAQLANLRHTAHFDVRLVYEQKIDVAAEREKAAKELEKAQKEVASIDRQLSNEGFVTKAPAHVVEKLRNRKAELELIIAKMNQKLKELG